jgi:hypothetical protein
MSEPLETIHVYIVREDDADTQMVENTIHSTATLATQPLVPQSYPLRLRLVPYLLIAAHLLIVLTAFSLHAYLFLTETVTITILPKTAVVTAHLTMSNIESRIFQPLTLTQSTTVAATGHGHQDATQASGTITLYNASIQEQTIDAGTLFIGADGQHIVIDEAATIPGATPPLEGQTTVQAHAVNPGAAGNIPAGDIQGACCRENMFAYNSAFSGGADERHFTIVTQQDINSVVSSVVPALTQSIQAAFHQQVRPGELLTPNQCSQKVSPDRNVRDEASNVTVTVRESCIAGAYTNSDFHTKLQQALWHQAVKIFGQGYILSSYSLTAPMKTTIQKGTLVIAGTFQGRLIYHFSTRDITTLRQHLAGKTKQQGVALLAHLNGAKHISVQMEQNAPFPTDPTHIHILFLVVS